MTHFPNGSCKLFGIGHISDHSQTRLRSIFDQIQSENANYLLNANEDDLVAFYVSKIAFEPVTLHWNQMEASDREEFVPGSRFPFGFAVSYGEAYRKQIVSYHVPFSGDPNLLDLYGGGVRYDIEVRVDESVILFDFINFYDDPDKVKVASDQTFRHARAACEEARASAEAYNRSFPEEIRAAVQQRKAEHLKRSNTLASLGVPIKRSGNATSTYAVPLTKRKATIARPNAPTTAFAPEPTLAESEYAYILEVIHATGVEMERHSSLHVDKGEEALRDCFLMGLASHYDNATGETFNKTGKTDILIRHDGRNVFVAECKIWGGGKLYLETIDQLLKYLTWRDSKTAIMLFVENKDLSAVLEAIRSLSETHPSFVRTEGRREESWFSFVFHLSGDRNRQLKLAVLAFHFPRTAPSVTD